MMKSIDYYRKNPKQARSQATVDAILEAAARILQAEGPRAATTNAIARLAGVGIGTLYQYFPDKNAILITLARQELALTGEAVNAGMSPPMDAGENVDPLRVSIHALIQGFKGRLRTRKALIEALIANGLTEELTFPVDLAMKEVLAAGTEGGDAGGSGMTPVKAYVLTRAIVGVIRSAAMEETAYFGTQEFEDELVKLAHGLMAV
ncbi:TetR family transcriptional regulator [Breoghania corrubedonensis]|uniref:TetR family transcriptional regulator n=1 Tax=Breoghania corrubedonensis TaxID=665038 RepID=A0A2T5VAV6_9HYPH|nr:TetR/AcrR family transcriptional regulator [Breoghania corrubedonensis]PTW60892.1 TetR family transcriptional regulator [Breoghania corrubedonensis]